MFLHSVSDRLWSIGTSPISCWSANAGGLLLSPYFYWRQWLTRLRQPSKLWTIDDTQNGDLVPRVGCEDCILYIYFEKSFRKKCTRQSRKVFWVVLSLLFFKEIWKNVTRSYRGLMFASAKGNNKSRFDSYSVRNSVLIICHITCRECQVEFFFSRQFKIAVSQKQSKVHQPSFRSLEIFWMCNEIIILIVCNWRYCWRAQHWDWAPLKSTSDVFSFSFLFLLCCSWFLYLRLVCVFLFLQKKNRFSSSVTMVIDVQIMGLSFARR